MVVAKIAVLHTCEGGVGKSLIAYEEFNLLNDVLVDVEHDCGGVTAKWGYRPQDYPRAPDFSRRFSQAHQPQTDARIQEACTGARPPRLYDHRPDAETMAEALTKGAHEWPAEWGHRRHPSRGQSRGPRAPWPSLTSCWRPTALRTAELDATAELVYQIADYPLVIVPNFVPTTPPAAEIRRLRQIIENTPVQVAPPIPTALHVGTRKKRIAITAENPSAKSLQRVADALGNLATFMKGYVDG